MDPYQLAKNGLCHYTGDMNPLDHDGAWYNSINWTKDGYADCVRVNCMPDGPDGGKHVVLELLTILRIDAASVKRALKSCGRDETEWLSDQLPLVEIEACLGYGHYDPQGGDYREPQSYSFIIPDDSENTDDFKAYARIHGAKMTTEE